MFITCPYGVLRAGFLIARRATSRTSVARATIDTPPRATAMPICTPAAHIAVLIN